ncbi:HIT domain-containing protein [Candidatus Saccharibacteria bacterium]|nr:HIT domain-containing protein [Candidatus Saccharibacteria bacterium]
MKDSIFMKIIRGEVPAHRLYEDEKTLAFLTIQPESLGHTLVIPKIEVDKIYDLPDDYYQAMWATAKKVAQKLENFSGQRSLIKVIGTDVPHAHIHVFSASANYPKPPEIPMADDAELADVAAKLRTK